MRTGSVLLLLSSLCCAQAPQTMENTGKPMRLPLACGDEEVAALGLTCPPRQPCPVFLELAAFEAVGNRMFLAGNLHTESATVASVLLASDDSGKTWHEPHVRIPTAVLESIKFYDLEWGWISGHTLAAGIPRDPFLLLTRDGGKTWRARPVSEESRSGSIQSFKFDTRNEGVLWVDRALGAVEGNRYESYATKTGGESWSLAEMTDRAPNVKRESAPAAGWRLRADGTAYRLELAGAGGWQPVAAFLIRAGECRESELKLAEPPPDQPPAAVSKPEPGQPAKPRRP